MWAGQVGARREIMRLGGMMMAANSRRYGYMGHGARSTARKARADIDTCIPQSDTAAASMAVRKSRFSRVSGVARRRRKNRDLEVAASGNQRGGAARHTAGARSGACTARADVGASHPVHSHRAREYAKCNFQQGRNPAG